MFAGVIIDTKRGLNGKPKGMLGSFISNRQFNDFYIFVISSRSSLHFKNCFPTCYWHKSSWCGVILNGETEANPKSSMHNSDHKGVNLAIVASILFSGVIGMAIGFEYHFIALIPSDFLFLCHGYSNSHGMQDKWRINTEFKK